MKTKPKTKGDLSEAQKAICDLYEKLSKARRKYEAIADALKAQGDWKTVCDELGYDENHTAYDVC